MTTPARRILANASSLEEMLARRLASADLPTPARQFRAVPRRKLAFDFAWPAQRVLLEVQGVQGARGHAGGHRGIGGFVRDCEKLSLAAAHGWRVVVVTRRDVTSGRAVEWIRAALAWTG